MHASKSLHFGPNKRSKNERKLEIYTLSECINYAPIGCAFDLESKGCEMKPNIRP